MLKPNLKVKVLEGGAFGRGLGHESGLVGLTPLSGEREKKLATRTQQEGRHL